jgi:hypothetical protein
LQNSHLNPSFVSVSEKEHLCACIMRVSNACVIRKKNRLPQPPCAPSRSAVRSRSDAQVSRFWLRLDRHRGLALAFKTALPARLALLPRGSLESLGSRGLCWGELNGYSHDSVLSVNSLT